MDEADPIRISPKSPRRTAWGHTLDPAPSVTFPMTTASGWTKASASMRGRRHRARKRARPWTLHVRGDPGHALVAAVAEVDDAGHQHHLEVPGDRLALLIGQDGAAGGALAFVAQVLVFYERVALLAPRHQVRRLLTCRRCARAASSALRRTRTSRAGRARCSGCT